VLGTAWLVGRDAAVGGAAPERGGEGQQGGA